MNNYEIQPLVGYGELTFGLYPKQAFEIIGEPDNTEVLDITEDGNKHVVYQYDKLDLSLYFEGVEKSVLAYIELTDENSTLFGQPIFTMKKDKILELMRSKGYNVFESEVEDEELRISFFDLDLDFFFVEDELDAICWGVTVDVRGNIVSD